MVSAFAGCSRERGEGGFGSGHGGIHVVSIPHRDLPDDLFVGGVDDVIGARDFGIYPFAVDVELEAAFHAFSLV
jgi:hypothetical protein